MPNGLSEHVWTKGLALLSERFGKKGEPLSEEMCMVYLEQINASLDDDTFIAAVKVLIRNKPNAYGYFPSPSEIIDAGMGALGSADAEEAVACAALLWHAAHPTYDPRGYYVSLAAVQERDGVTVMRAIESIGGSARLVSMTDRDVSFVLRDFRDAWRAYHAEAKHQTEYRVLLGATTERRLASARIMQIGASADDAVRALTSGAAE